MVPWLPTVGLGQVTEGITAGSGPILTGGHPLPQGTTASHTEGLMRGE